MVDIPPPSFTQVVQIETILPGAQKVDVSSFFPPTALSATVRATITPATGAILIYTPGKTEPVKINGPVSIAEIPLAGSFIYIRAAEGTANWNIEGLGWRDNVNAN